MCSIYYQPISLTSMGSVFVGPLCRTILCFWCPNIDNSVIPWPPVEILAILTLGWKCVCLDVLCLLSVLDRGAGNKLSSKVTGVTLLSIVCCANSGTALLNDCTHRLSYIMSWGKG